MNSQTEELVSNCSTCLHHANANQREPLHPHEIPSRPKQKVGTDLFDWNGKPHLIVVDYYSPYPEVSEHRRPSGGLHEKTFQTVKNPLEKCKVANEDPYLALLDYRNTPIDGVPPAKALMSRRLRSPLPISQRKLNPKPINRTTFHATRQQQQQQQRKHYDRTAKSLPPLEKGDAVRFKKDPQAAWTRGTVIRKKHEASAT